MEKVKQYYEKKASNYDSSLEKWGYNRVIEEYLVRANVKLPKESRILDLGCGTGVAINKLRELYPSVEIIGLDISHSMLKKCEEKMPDTTLIQGDYNKQQFSSFPDGIPYKFKEKSFDLITSTGSLTEYGNLDEVIPFLFTLLKPGGHLINIGHQVGIINTIVLYFWKGKSTSKNRLKKKCIDANFESVNYLSMPLIKNIWSRRKYCAVAKVPKKKNEEAYSSELNPNFVTKEKTVRLS